MEPRIHVLTLGVGDLKRALAFYRALGFESPGLIGTQFEGDETTPAGAAAMFELRDGLLLMLHPGGDAAAALRGARGGGRPRGLARPGRGPLHAARPARGVGPPPARRDDHRDDADEPLPPRWRRRARPRALRRRAPGRARRDRR